MRRATTEMQSSATSAKTRDGTGDGDVAISIMMGNLVSHVRGDESVSHGPDGPKVGQGWRRLADAGAQLCHRSLHLGGRDGIRHVPQIGVKGALSF